MSNTYEQIINHPVVESYKLWEAGKHKRTYLSLIGFNRNYKGCMTSKIYFDHNTEKLVIEMGKGICNSEFLASRNALVKAFLPDWKM